MLLITFIFIAVLAFLVLIHEFGHFFAAKKFGVFVEEFGFGFPPRVLGKKIGETLYSINLLPIGGFVKVYGEMYHEEKTDEKMSKRAFVNQHPFKKSIILVAGIFMNLMLAVGIYYILLASNGFKSEPIPMLNKYSFRFGSELKQVVVGRVVDGSPASLAGVTVGDLVVRISLDNKSWTEITSAEQMISLIGKTNNQPAYLEFYNINDGTIKKASILPKFDEKLNRPLIGVGLTDAVTLSYQKPVEIAASGFLHSYNVVAYSLDTMKMFLGASYEQKSLGPVSDTVAGPVGIYKLVEDIVKSSGPKLLINLAQLVALLSLSLALINVFPFPALDGGRLVFVIYEWVSKKRPNARVEQYVNMIGFMVLILLAIVISINDITKLMK